MQQTMKFSTENSVYEVDLDRKRMRRVSGAMPPTARQGKDGVWKSYHHTTPEIPQVGTALFIDWDDDGHYTITSLIQEIERDTP